MSVEFDIFISYQWNIKNEVKEIVNLLHNNGFKVWVDDRYLRPDGDLFPELSSAIKRSKTFISFITKAYDNSKNCYREINWADTCGKTILVVMFEDLKISDLDKVGFIINTRLRINYYQDKSNEKLIQEIKKVVRPSNPQIDPPNNIYRTYNQYSTYDSSHSDKKHGIEISKDG